MIFVTLGTHEQPFERALDVVAPIAGRGLVIQHGYTPPRADIRAAWIEFTDYDEVSRLIAQAEAVVCHAGVGTILTALAGGKTPVVVPRLREHGEHVDDHQLQIATAFADRGFVVPCNDGADLPAALDRAIAGRPQLRRAEGDFGSVVAAAAAGQPPPRRPRRRARHRISLGGEPR